MLLIYPRMSKLNQNLDGTVLLLQQFQIYLTILGGNGNNLLLDDIHLHDYSHSALNSPGHTCHPARKKMK